MGYGRGIDDIEPGGDAEYGEEYGDDECLREFEIGDPVGGCTNDHTGCIWNDGSNGCSAPGRSSHPLLDD